MRRSRMGSAGAGHQSLALVRYPPYHEVLLGNARQLITAGHFQAAVLIAHMACEVCTGQVIVGLMERRGLEEAQEWAEEYRESFSFLNPTVRALYFSLTGERINIAFRRWREHAGSVELRNRLSHRGARVTEAQAENACDVVQALTARLRRALDRAK